MKTRSVLASLLAFFAGLALCYASDSQMGTWKLNESRSRLAPSGAKNTLVVYSPAGDHVKVTIDGVDKDGKAIHSEWTGKFDGKDYPVTGDPNSDLRSYTTVDANTTSYAIKKRNKIVSTGRITVAADGKSRTVTGEGTDAQGKRFSTSLVYDKQ
jgi:hypothetical protein